MSAEPRSAPPPLCRDCRGPLPLSLDANELRCTYCGSSQPCDEALRTAMRAYVGDYAAARRAELEARWVEAFYDQNANAATPIVVGAVGLAIALTGLFMAWILGNAFATDIALVYAGPLVLVYAGSVAAFAWGWATMYAVPAPEALARVSLVQCAGCGAYRRLPEGQASVTCLHCRGTVLVPMELARGVLGAVRSDSTEARSNRGDAYRRAVRAGDRLVTGSVIAVVLLTVVGTLTVITLGRAGGPMVSIGELTLTFVGLSGLAIASMVRSTRSGMRSRASLDALIEDLTPAPPAG